MDQDSRFHQSPTSGDIAPDGEAQDKQARSNATAIPEQQKGSRLEATARQSPMEGEASEQQEPELPFSKARCIALVATLTGASFLNTLGLQTVVIILPTIGESVNIPESRLQWVVSSYALTFGCFLLLWGRIADVFGKRLIFIGGSVWVAVVCAVNAFMPNEISFDIFRGLHGLGAAANVPTAIGILGVTFPPSRAKNYAFSAYAAGAPLGSVFGNMVSGLIAENASWKWVFGACAIMAGLISLAGVFVIPPSAPSPTSSTKPQTFMDKAASIDWFGAFLVTVGLLALMLALTEGNVVGWSTPWIPVLIVVSILILAAFAYWQHHIETRLLHRKPLVKVSMFRNLRFSAAIVIMGFFFASFNSYLIFATYYFQTFQGLSPLQTMLRFIPTGVAGTIVVFIVARLLHKVPTIFFLICGNLCNAGACLLFAVPIPPTTTYFAYGLPAMVLSVIGADTTWPSLTLFTSHSLPREDQAIGGALINASGQLGRAIGLAIATAVQTSVMASARRVPVEKAGGMEPWDSATLRGLHAGNWTNFGIGLLSLGLVLIAFRSMEIIGKVTPVKSPANIPGPQMGIKDEESRNEK